MKKGGPGPPVSTAAQELGAVEQEACGVLRLQAFVGGVENRSFHGHFTEGEGGARDFQLERAARAGIVVFAATIAVDR